MIEKNETPNNEVQNESLTPAEVQGDELFQYEETKPEKQKKIAKKGGFWRKFTPVFILLGVCALLGTAYLILRIVNPENRGEEQVNETSVVTLNANDIKTVAISNEQDQYVLHKKAGSAYKIEKYEDKAVEEDVIATSFASLADISTIKKVLVENDKLKDYGLEKPVANVTITTTLKTVQIFLGNPRPEKTGGTGDYYAYLKDDADHEEGKTSVFILEEEIANIILADHFYYYTSNISGYNKDDDAIVSPLRIGGKKGTAVSVYMADDESGLAYVMEEPINMPFATTAMDSILSLLTTLNGALPYSDDVSAENLTKTGLAEPDYELEYTYDGKKRTIEFGAVEDGLIYCMLKDDNIIYRTDASAVECLGLDIRNMCDILTYTRDVDSISRIKLMSANKTYDMVLDGKGENRIVHVNNKQVQSAIFSDFYICLLSMEVNGVADKPQTEPYLTVEITLDASGQKEIMKFYKVDDRHYFYELNGKGMFTVKHQSVEDLITNAQKLYENKELTQAW